MGYSLSDTFDCSYGFVLCEETEAEQKEEGTAGSVVKAII